MEPLACAFKKIVNRFNLTAGNWAVKRVSGLYSIQALVVSFISFRGNNKIFNYKYLPIQLNERERANLTWYVSHKHWHKFHAHNDKSKREWVNKVQSQKRNNNNSMHKNKLKEHMTLPKSWEKKRKQSTKWCVIWQLVTVVTSNGNIVSIYTIYDLL